MIFDNIFTISIVILEVEIDLSICWLSICFSIEHQYGKFGQGKYWGIGKRYAMEPKKEKDE